MSKRNQKGTGPAAPQTSQVAGKVAQLKDFFEESKVELKKVTWPTRKETTTTSIAVLVLVVVMSLFLGIVDLGLSKLVELILS
ncbi:MAG: preprotein translocase subunit SecE [Desulfovibrionaceae bacterium]|jgi:preprotein translocase subunit SecE|nr:preprotein translocase subunit SecE [Desulfovibrionaceae bacterium]